MSKRKNIDQLFKERFENHEVTPPAQVWENIQAAMREEKKERKVIPLWWKVGGIAALLALLFTIGTTVFNTSNNNQLVEDSVEKENIDKKVSPYINEDKEFNTNNNALKVAEETTNKSHKESSIIEGDATTKNMHSSDNYKTTNNTEIASEKTGQQNSTTKKAIEQSTINKSKNISETIAQNETTRDGNKETRNNTKNAVVISTNQKNGTKITHKTNPDTERIAQATKEEETAIKNPSSEILPQTIDTESTNAIAEETDSKNKTVEELESEKQSIFDAIKEQNDVDSKEAVVENDTPKDRWEVAPNFAPVYYNTLSEGSSIDGNFADNSQSGDVNISYGVAVSYAVSNRLSIRSGINNVNLGYSTGGLELGEGDVTAALKNVDYNRSSQVIIPQDKGTFAAQNAGGDFDNITPKATNGEAFVNQNITYYEVPLELKYSLFDTKLGVNLIGGLSTLFLGDNEITVNAGDFSEILGEANNLSSVSFSTNVGLGFDYKFSKKFKFNIEPMFKYQLNPYTDSSVNFQPYYIGIYTGLSYKF